MTETPMLFAATLASRMLIVAAVVVIASLAVERAGPLLGAMIATLPLSAGPAYVFLAIDHGSAFIAASATFSLLSVSATAVFLLVYIAMPRATGTALALGAALAGWGVSLAALSRFSWTMPAALALLFGLHAAAIAATGRFRRAAIRITSRPKPWQIAVRALAVMVLVAAVTLVGRWLGPGAAGLVALVPIVFSSLIVVLQPRVGPGPMKAVTANALVGMVGYGFGLGLLNMTAVPLGSAAALVLALAACIAWNALVMGLPRLLGRPL